MRGGCRIVPGGRGVRPLCGRVWVLREDEAFEVGDAETGRKMFK